MAAHNGLDLAPLQAAIENRPDVAPKSSITLEIQTLASSQ
jgi:hypothetical protein